MGMDVFGIAPSSKTGEYFRNNVWYWSPLWTYVTQTYAHLLPADTSQGFYNDGYALDAPCCALLAKALTEDLANGRVQTYETEFNRCRSELPLDDCGFCDGTGIRTDHVGETHQMPTAELPPVMAIIVGRTHGTCNACQGLGKLESAEASYHFTVDNVREFAQFLMDCGGLTIT